MGKGFYIYVSLQY